MYILRRLLWVDCIAAALGGVTVLMLNRWLSRLCMLPRSFLLFIGGVNLVYASYSFSLAVRDKRSRYSINLLVFANLTWAVLCLAWPVIFWQSVTRFGIGHLVGESIFVGGLAGFGVEPTGTTAHGEMRVSRLTPVIRRCGISTHCSATPRQLRSHRSS